MDLAKTVPATSEQADERAGDWTGEWTGEWIGIDHVQLAIPVGGEDVARAFYVEVLGLVEEPKPAIMAARGGCWFGAGAVRIHVGVEESFVPARKAHPALTIRALESFIARTGLDATWNTEIDGLTRCHVWDPFGNRIELVEVVDPVAS